MKFVIAPMNAPTVTIKLMSLIVSKCNSLLTRAKDLSTFLLYDILVEKRKYRGINVAFIRTLKNDIARRRDISLSESDKKIKEDRTDEGRAEYFMDIDRMINEGLGGGRVNINETGIIEQSLDLVEEEPPRKE